MKKINLIELNCCDENDMIKKVNVDEIFDSWKEYYNEIVSGSLDTIEFKYKDIDKSVFYVDDGGELIRLINGSYYNICWRCECCRVWIEDDDEMINYYNKLYENTK